MRELNWGDSGKKYYKIIIEYHIDQFIVQNKSRPYVDTYLLRSLSNKNICLRNMGPSFTLIIGRFNLQDQMLSYNL